MASKFLSFLGAGTASSPGSNKITGTSIQVLYNSPAKYEIILRYGMTSFNMLTQLLIKKQE